jgi:predicted RNA methylase
MPTIPERSHDDFGYNQFSLHLSMLSDYTRNRKYAKAIKYADLRNKRVLDIGSGTGFLSILAAKAGAKRVYSCEITNIINESQPMIQDSLTEEEYDKITVINKNINDCTLDDLDGKKVDVIISEWMGTLLLHERFLEVIIASRDRFLKSDGLMIPSDGAIEFCLASSTTTYDDLCDDLSFWEEGGDEEQDFEELYGIQLEKMYDNAKYNLFRHSIIENIDKEDCVLSDTISIPIDFKTVSIQDIVNIHSSDKSFRIKYNDNAYAICGFFTVNFHDMSGEFICRLQTGPGHDTHWNQSLLYLNEPVSVNRKQRIPFKLTMDVFDRTSYNVKTTLIIDGENINHSHITHFVE